MPDIIKQIWILLFVISLMGLLSMLPVEKYQKAYLNELNRIKTEPQRRIEATYRYIEAIEDGLEPTENGILYDPPEKFYEQSNQISQKISPKKYQKPLYIRDKKNPKILHPYPGN
ncbi:hypothetical protein IJ541_04210 [bacterium]|nr:hypothetical protein [bacterium]